MLNHMLTSLTNSLGKPLQNHPSEECKGLRVTISSGLATANLEPSQAKVLASAIAAWLLVAPASYDTFGYLAQPNQLRTVRWLT